MKKPFPEAIPFPAVAAIHADRVAFSGKVVTGFPKENTIKLRKLDRIPVDRNGTRSKHAADGFLHRVERFVRRRRRPLFGHALAQQLRNRSFGIGGAIRTPWPKSQPITINACRSAPFSSRLR